jgi:hypothetical protein
MRRPPVPLRHNRLARGILVASIGAWIAGGLLVAQVLAEEPDKVTLTVEAGSNGTFRITAEVVDAGGAPVADVPVLLQVRTTFGWLSVARGVTDAAGRIQATLPAGLRVREIAAEAGDEGSIRTSVRFGERKFGEPAVRPGREALSGLSPQPGFISPYPVPLQVALLAVILGGIWSTYGYVVWLLSRIRDAH